jgi:hypothetical protein
MEKVQTLMAKASAGAKIKESEWFPWQRGPQDPAKWRHEETETEVTLRIRYLEAIGKDETEANPNAIYWDAYDALQAGKVCDVCGRGGDSPCEPCSDWENTLTRRPEVRKRVAA